MKIKKSKLIQQRQIIEKKMRPWLTLAREQRPKAGWIKAVRGALGMTTEQLADRLDIGQAGVVRLEEREVSGALTLETLQRAAKALECKVVYAFVPENHKNLEEILHERAERLARELLKKAAHSMSLEAQEVGESDQRLQLARLTRELKEQLHPKLWVDE